MFAVTHRYKETRNIDERKKSRENTELVVLEKSKKKNRKDRSEDHVKSKSNTDRKDRFIEFYFM